MTSDSDAKRPLLQGVRVLDFSRVVSGPHCGRMLADMGAEVIKIEPPEGDLTRYAVPRVNSLATYFIQQNCGKKNISLDLSRKEGVDLLHRLVPHADVVLENFRPGVMDRLGLGFDELTKINPKIIYASITGYGQQGPWSDRPSYAPTIHADMGFMEMLARRRDGTVSHDPFSHADIYASLECLSAILAALFVRERTGEGQHIDVSMAETLLCINEHTHSEVAGFNLDLNNLLLSRSPIFSTKEGHWITIAGDPLARATFGAYLRAIDRPDLGEDPRFSDDESRRDHKGEFLQIVQDWVNTFDDLELLDKAFQKGRLVMGVVRSVSEAAATEWARSRGAVVEVPDRAGGKVAIPNSPWRFSNAATGVQGEPAYRGEHNREILSELLGMGDEEIDAFESQGILSSRPPRSA